MENIAGKAAFLKNEYTQKLATLNPATPQLWGKMNVQQMIEHMYDYVRLANGKDVRPVVTPADMLPRFRDFLLTEKPFRENTPNPIMPDTPVPVKKEKVQDAIAALQAELDDLFTLYEKEPGKVVTNPIFGDLDHDMSVQLLHKHAWHHLRQFGING